MLRDRAIADELMDADDLDVHTYAAVVHDLSRVNSVTLARRATLAFLDRVHQRSGKRATPLKILDVGFGNGDMLRAIHRWGHRRGVAVSLVGIDLNPRSMVAARAATADVMAIEYRTGDYEQCADDGFDCIISSLVAHHMTPEQLIAFLRFMDRHARTGWLVNDLHRHGFAYLGFPVLAMLMRSHAIVRHDGRLSIARSYRPHEWPPLLQQAGITDARVQRVFPFRLCVSRIR
jgi:2-polyprenyl-3-methyl-5-hydroxy-6-metoxy-1,4-benzoquinol methylase